MGRPKRAADGGLVYHVLNRANARMTIFEKPEDYDAFGRVLEEAAVCTKTRLLAYCVMPNHWHLMVWPRADGELSRFTVCRYVEWNALRANLVQHADAWRWGSLYRWKHGNAKEQSLLASWPLPRLPDWVKQVNAPQTEAELSALRRSVQRGCPFGDPSWLDQTVHRLGLQSTIRPQGRPKKRKNGS